MVHASIGANEQQIVFATSFVVRCLRFCTRSFSTLARVVPIHLQLANVDISSQDIVRPFRPCYGRAWSTMSLGPTVPLNTQGVRLLIVDAVLAALASIWTALRFHSRRMHSYTFLPEDWMILGALVRRLLYGVGIDVANLWQGHVLWNGHR